MEKITNKENDWDHVTAASMVEGLIKNVTREEMAIAIKVMKPEKAPGPSESMCRDDICWWNFANACWMGKECQMNGKQVCWYQFLREREMLETAVLTEK